MRELAQVYVILGALFLAVPLCSPQFERKRFGEHGRAMAILSALIFALAWPVGVVIVIWMGIRLARRGQ